jgi:zinc transport system substrate-binding protein
MNGSRLGALLVTFVMAAGCGTDRSADPPDSKPLVVVSIFPLGDLAEQLVGETARVEVLLPPGASPATFDIAPRQLADLRDGKLFVMVGGGLDEWLVRVPESSGSTAPILRVADGLHLLAESDEHAHQGTGNPHIWLDPILVRDEVVPKLAEALAGVFPDAAEGVSARAEALVDSLTALDEEIRNSLQPLEQRAFIATHSAWSYFALRYNLEEAGVIHAHPGQDPSSREMAHLAEIARDRGLGCLFVEPQLGEVPARALAAELSLPTLSLDPLGGPAEDQRTGYFELLRFNTRQFFRGLGGPNP